MATKPQYYPSIASLDTILDNSGNDNKLRPPIEIREVGYDYLHKIPAEEFNWILNNISEWVKYLDSLSQDEAITEIATKDQAETGQASDVLMTPQRTLQSINYNAIPPGTVQYTAATSAPTGYLFADGSEVSRDTYTRLFDAIGTVWGSGDGSSTFNLPDLRDEFIRGANPGGGRDVGDSESDQIAEHTHSGSTEQAGAHSHTYTFPDTRDRIEFGRNETERGVVQQTQQTSVEGVHSHTFTTDPTGGSETRPQNKALLPIIKT